MPRKVIEKKEVVGDENKEWKKKTIMMVDQLPKFGVDQTLMIPVKLMDQFLNRMDNLGRHMNNLSKKLDILEGTIKMSKEQYEVKMEETMQVIQMLENRVRKLETFDGWTSSFSDEYNN
jgi:hypothetical protein